MNTARIIRTLRHLKPSQLGYQVVNRMRQRVTGPPVSRSGSESLERVRWQPSADFPRPLYGEAEQILAGRFEFVNEVHECAFPPSDWDCTSVSASKLWQYNLHYFDWMWALVPENAMVAVDDWIQRYPPARGKVGWDAYPLSLRLMNWVMYFCAEHRGFLELDENRGFRQRLFASLTEQAECLSRCPEKHLLANHYLENGAALAMVGSCFAGEPVAQAWLDEGLRILDEQLAEQCPPDGLHFERSPMYHLRLVLVLEMLMATGNPQLQERTEPTLARARRALGHVSHPDGDIALLADSALGIYPMPSGKLDRSFGAFALPNSGYFGYRSENGDYVICDFGAPGPAYNPGHAHAGLFSFELSVAGQRVISDSGAATYRPGDERIWARSTAAHNTVELDGEDQAEMWGAFRIGRRPQVKGLCWKDTTVNGRPGFVIEAEHDGYRHGANPRAHSRRISFDAELRLLRVEDRVRAAKSSSSARVLFNLEPGVGVDVSDADEEVLRRGGREMARMIAIGEGNFVCGRSALYRRFHQRENRTLLERQFSGKRIDVCTDIQLEG